MSRWLYWCPSCRRKRVFCFRVGGRVSDSVWLCGSCKFSFEAKRSDVKNMMFKDFKVIKEIK